jgi:hypothetical protein
MAKDCMAEMKPETKGKGRMAASEIAKAILVCQKETMVGLQKAANNSAMVARTRESMARTTLMK